MNHQAIKCGTQLPVPSTQCPFPVPTVGSRSSDWVLATDNWVPLSPAVHTLPPDQLHPLVEGDLGPFAIGPPGNAEVVRIVRRRHAELVLWQAPAEGAQGAAGVELGGD